MRILFNQRVLAGRKTGVGYYASHLLDAMRAQAGDHQIDCFPMGSLWSAYRVGVSLRPLWERLRSGSRRLGWLGWLAPLATVPDLAVRCLRDWGEDMMRRQFRALFDDGRYALYHEPNFIPLPTELPTVATLHDLSVLLHPEWHPAARVRFFESRFRRGLRQCEHLITVSETVRQEVIRLLNVPPTRVTRVYNGVPSHLEPLPPGQTARALRRLQLRGGYLLYLGTLEPRKNVLRLLRAYCTLPQALRERSPLLLVGSWGWKYEEVAEYYQTVARHRGVRHLGYVAERFKPALYSGARALVYPSYYEGFGLPCVEMLACGGAVLASTADVFQETIGGQAQLLPAEDPDAWREAMARVIGDDDYWQQLRRGGPEVARRYTWENSAAGTLAVYRTVCGEAAATRPLGQVA